MGGDDPTQSSFAGSRFREWNEDDQPLLEVKRFCADAREETPPLDEMREFEVRKRAFSLSFPEVGKRDTEVRTPRGKGGLGKSSPRALSKKEEVEIKHQQQRDEFDSQPDDHTVDNSHYACHLKTHLTRHLLDELSTLLRAIRDSDDPDHRHELVDSAHVYIDVFKNNHL